MLEICIEPAIQNRIGDRAQHGEAVYSKKYQVFCMWWYSKFYVIDVSDVSNCKQNESKYNVITRIIFSQMLLNCKPRNTFKRPYLYRANTLTNGNHMEWKPMNSKEHCDEEEDLSSLFTSFDGHLSVVSSSKWRSRLSPFIYYANDLCMRY